MSDVVNHPSHYNAHPSGVECITVTEHMNFNLGNAVKYIWRAGLKSDTPVTDLEKARAGTSSVKSRAFVRNRR